MNKKAIQKRSIIKKEIVKKYDISRTHNDVEYPCNNYGDVWIKIKTTIANKKLVKLQTETLFINTLANVEVENLIELVNLFYEGHNADENTTVLDLIEPSFYKIDGNNVYIKTGIYQRIMHNGRQVYTRSLETADVEFELFMNLILLSNYPIEIDNTIFLGKPYDI